LLIQWLTHQLNLSSIRMEQLANDVEHCGLATPVRTQQTYNFPTRYLQAKARQHLLFAEPLEQAIDLQGRGHTF
jgi:hypothetical protein